MDILSGRRSGEGVTGRLHLNGNQVSKHPVMHQLKGHFRARVSDRILQLSLVVESLWVTGSVHWVMFVHEHARFVKGFGGFRSYRTQEQGIRDFSSLEIGKGLNGFCLQWQTI